jgi:alkylation response protein AidB-like acyl-CoA dehydrogenase
VDFELSAQHRECQELARVAAREVVEPFARSSDEEGVFREETVRELGRRGLGRVAFEDGALAMSLVYEELGRVDSSVRGFLTVQIGLVAQCIADWGTDAQRENWLEPLKAIEAIGCYCLTEPDAGSDARSITTTAERTATGWVIRGEKHWITNGGVADVALVFARAPEGITAFLVPTSTSGLHRSRMAGRELGHRGADHASLRFDGISTSADAVLGEVGGGFKVAMSALSHGRLGVASGAVGVHEACLEASLQFARQRRQFGKRIGDFEMIQAALADMAAELDASRLLVRRAAWMADAGQDVSQPLAIAKLYCCEAALRAADQAILLHGARGYSNLYPVERYWRDAKGMQIYEGTAHMQRIIVARGLLGREPAPPAAE